MHTSGREIADASGARCPWVCSFGVWITRGQQGQVLHRIPAPPGEGAKLCLCFCHLGRAGLALWDRSSPGSSQQYPGNTSTPHTCACGTRIPLPGEGRIALLPARRGAAGKMGLGLHRSDLRGKDPGDEQGHRAQLLEENCPQRAARSQEHSTTLMEAGFPVYILPKQVLVRCSFDFQPHLPWSSPAKLPTRLVGQH